MIKNIAILIPCYNEEHSIADTVLSFNQAIPTAKVYVYDNNSTDKTFEIATTLNCEVRREPQQGKGAVVRRMFADIEADVYVLVDGDNTYDAAISPDLVKLLLSEHLDMVVGARTRQISAYPKGHILGNKLFSKIVSAFFDSSIQDVFSGYRVMTKRFVKSFPITSHGFEIETEMTVHALQLGLPIQEIETNYAMRKENSKSKLNTYRDGFRILRFIFFLIREQKPLLFFMFLSLLCVLCSIGFGSIVLSEYFDTGFVSRIPTAILASGIGILGILFFAMALILESISNGRKEIKRLHYLSLK
ncbi:glycosyltransferase family 2 protein [Pasteurella dagmatis]|uniref:Glycosyltransferase, group 2 family protein n=1 Tax=Pasteurella dagmatis ATCC 43325 TaxID=667128 RepID=C9PRC4_9PAST|nr:glycosyltransferase family 2 protein [Pasteurella dagmatis]EEX50025.1 glycosyltransferase, group 2 family protein [Pasteurella dagmatis ATCC 43325]SNV61741.1 N-glycosyltransferase [Pasteurella dagmatis]